MRTKNAALVFLLSLVTLALDGHAGFDGQFTKAIATPVPHALEKAATVQSLASRATSSPAATVYGAFALSGTTTVYILVRGPSLTTLGVTPNALDVPWTRLFDQSGNDLISTAGTPGFTTCVGSAATDAPVVNYYQAVRNAPVHSRDSCIAVSLPAGAYTFSVTPSMPGTTSPAGGAVSSPASGEILFEVTLGPSGPVVNQNQAQTSRLVGGTWSYTYTIINTYTDRYVFNSVIASTAVPGDYAAIGTDEFGGTVVGSYVSSQRQWAVLDPGSIIDLFFIFTFVDNNRVSGCYHQISPPGSTNASRCYSMTGSRFPPKALGAPRTKDPLLEQRQLEEASAGEFEPDPEVIEAYLRARNFLKNVSK
jgi:hypothetical protein